MALRLNKCRCHCAASRAGKGLGSITASKARSSPISASTARIAAPAAGLMSGLRRSNPGVFCVWSGVEARVRVSGSASQGLGCERGPASCE
eukprot:scaffold23361_cov68-Phaeocystis_antarctica.AAC.5